MGMGRPGQQHSNMDQERLAKRVTLWRDSEWWRDQPRGASAYGFRPMRARPGNILRWEDDLRKFAESLDWGSWQSIARSTEWGDFSEQFGNWAWR